MKEKHDIKWNKGHGSLRAIAHPAKFSTCHKLLKNSLIPVVIVTTFNFSLKDSEARESLSLMSA